MDAAIASKALKSLKRIEGQVRGVARMIEADRYCIDVVNQIEAVRAALARVEADLLSAHMRSCVIHAMSADDTAERTRVIEELVAVFRK
jgi:DNA-binding FrmR family transcriptional regulator